MLQLGEVFLVKKPELIILVKERLEETLSCTPFNRVAQLEIAHAFTLDALKPKVFNRLLVLNRETMRIVDGSKCQLDVKVVWTER